MGQSIRCFPFCNEGCALSVQKINSFSTRKYQNNSFKPATDKHFR